VTNIEVQRGNAQSLKYSSASFDAIYAITEFGEMSGRPQTLTKFWWDLMPGGALALSKFLPDPGSQSPTRVQTEYKAVGFCFEEKARDLLHNIILFERSGE
jgi:ubiquinone/menaquinone biosynthesis C-methylase UbiE